VTTHDGIEEVRSELHRLAERLGDLAYEQLRRAVDDGATKRPELERRLTRARRAVERAAHLLGGDDGDDGESDLRDEA